MNDFKKEKRGGICFFNCDCMDYMAQLKDNEIDLIICDPPYGIDINNQSQGKGGGVAKKIEYAKKDWDKQPPNEAYFKELIRVSKNQIIFGANHFISKIPFDSSCWIVWDKDNGATDFADCELAWTSFNTAVRKFKWLWSGMLQQNMKNKQKRIHPTQKPIELYRWLLMNYAEKGMKILDTHGGSMSIAIACDMEGFDLDICEIDTEYFESGLNAFDNYKRQLKLF